MHHNGPEGFDIMSSRIHRKHRQNRPSATTAAHNPALSMVPLFLRDGVAKGRNAMEGGKPQIC
jgi:hypothetical protein